MKRRNILANVDDPRQDIHKERRHDANLYRYKVAEELLSPNCRNTRVLELGGGVAEFSRRMKEKGIIVEFADGNQHNVTKARDLGIRARQLDLNNGLAPFPTGRFDGVVMLEVIEHVVAAEFLLEEIHRVLKPNGFLILSTPNFAFVFNRLRVLAGRLSHDEGYHYRFFTVRTLRERLSKAGFVLERSAHSMPAFVLNFIRRRILHLSRVHVRVPDILAPIFALTLMVRAQKKQKR